MEPIKDATKLYPRQPISRITTEIRPESTVYEVISDRMHNNTVDAIIKGDLITACKTNIADIQPNKQYVVTDIEGNIILGYIDVSASNEKIAINPLNKSSLMTELKFSQVSTVELIYLLDRTINGHNCNRGEIVFEPKQEELTQNEYEAFIGLTYFISAPNPFDSRLNLSNDPHPGSFCFQADDLFSGLYEFVGGRFKEDHHLSNLQTVFRDGLSVKPWMADKYFSTYSQLMELLVHLYNAAPLIQSLSGAFENLANKQEFFEIADTVHEQLTY